MRTAFVPAQSHSRARPSERGFDGITICSGCGPAHHFTVQVPDDVSRTDYALARKLRDRLVGVAEVLPRDRFKSIVTVNDVHQKPSIYSLVVKPRRPCTDASYVHAVSIMLEPISQKSKTSGYFPRDDFFSGTDH